ncbi:P60-like protein [Polychaeton citri CBS 116435]|uniref:Ribosome biogenesis protein NOP53 n=1 Tax=Polychaeton citri CBS 116435 TaxID=1314669 RepID=A0A9P4QCA8_9PEZI|nr:P60-like protein [Polychaeton citri CBS 116435]
MTDTAPATHRQPSRKGKKAWRKNVDLTEVQQGLEEVRDEIIQGGIVAEKAADELFTTDVQGDEEIEAKTKPKKLLKADEIISERSLVPGLSRRKRKATVDAPIPGSIKKFRGNGAYVKHKDLKHLQDVADNKVALRVDDDDAHHDPWAVPTAPVQDPRFSFLEPARPIKEPVTKQHAPRALTANGKAVPHVAKPNAGKSYNPKATDYTDLLNREGEAAVESERARLFAEAEAAERERRAVVEAAKVEAQDREEYATDYESAWESEWEGFQSEAEDQQGYTHKQHKRKTPAERNKVKARKEREAKEKWESKQRARDVQEQRIQQIIKETATKEKARQQLSALALQQDSSDSDSSGEQDKVQLVRRRFGTKQLPDAPLEVVLPDELEDSLRRLKPEGNLLTDRYRNLLINGKVEVRKRIGQVKQPKRDITEKWSYKDWQLK